VRIARDELLQAGGDNGSVAQRRRGGEEVFRIFRRDHCGLRWGGGFFFYTLAGFGFWTAVRGRFDDGRAGGLI
jgi:hypothetical protein